MIYTWIQNQSFLQGTLNYSIILIAAKIILVSKENHTNKMVFTYYSLLLNPSQMISE